MPRSTTVYDLLVSCPSDVDEAVDFIKNTIEDFNRGLGRVNNISVQIKHWRTDSYPQGGDSPQNILNKQFINQCDAVVAVFGTRFGTPTESYGSGTEEEIVNMIKSDKQVFLYFLKQKVDLDEVDLEQYKKVEEFKKEYEGLYDNVDSYSTLEKKFANHLNLYFLDKIITDNSVTTTEKKTKLEIKLRDNNLDKIETLKKSILEIIKSNITTLKSEIEEIIIPKNEFSEDKKEDESISIGTSFSRIFKNEEVVFNNLEIETIKSYFVAEDDRISDDFFFIGKLSKQRNFASIPGVASFSFNGTEDERKKYELITDLYETIIQFNDFLSYFKKLEAFKLLSLFIENSGNTFDEDIDVKLRINKRNIVEIKDIPLPEPNIIADINDLELLDKLFIPSEDEKIKKYPEYPMLTYKSYVSVPSLYGKSFAEKYEDAKEEYNDKIESIFCYKNFIDKNKVVMTFNLSYLKQNVCVNFPSYIIVQGDIESIEYEITSKHYPEVITGEVKI